MLHSELFKETTLYSSNTGALTLEALDYQPMCTYSILVSQVSYSLLVAMPIVFYVVQLSLL